MGPNCMCGTSHDPRNRFTDDQIFEKLPLTKFNFIKFAKFFLRLYNFLFCFWFTIELTFEIEDKRDEAPYKPIVI